MLEILSREMHVLQVSDFRKTAPIGMTGQPDFMNGAVRLETGMEMVAFRQYLKELEDRLGRDRTQPKYGPRCMDLDILIWNGKVVDDDYYSRDFLRQAARELGFDPDRANLGAGQSDWS